MPSSPVLPRRCLMRTVWDLGDARTSSSSGLLEWSWWGWPWLTRHSMIQYCMRSTRCYRRTSDTSRFSIIDLEWSQFKNSFWIDPVQAPFKEIYLHGLVRDEKGQKMSKTKGRDLSFNMFQQFSDFLSGKLIFLVVVCPVVVFQIDVPRVWMCDGYSLTHAWYSFVRPIMVNLHRLCSEVMSWTRWTPSQTMARTHWDMHFWPAVRGVSEKLASCMFMSTYVNHVFRLIRVSGWGKYWDGLRRYKVGEVSTFESGAPRCLEWMCQSARACLRMQRLQTQCWYQTSSIFHQTSHATWSTCQCWYRQVMSSHIL